jgi:hypothetical protein
MVVDRNKTTFFVFPCFDSFGAGWALFAEKTEGLEIMTVGKG